MYRHGAQAVPVADKGFRFGALQMRCGVRNYTLLQAEIRFGNARLDKPFWCRGSGSTRK